MSSKTIRRHKETLLASVEAIGIISEWLDHPPQQAQSARVIEWIKVGIAAFNKVVACVKGWGALEGMDDVLTKYGKDMSDERRQKLNDDAEQLFESLVKSGC